MRVQRPPKTKKLRLSTEPLRQLTAAELTTVAGGAGPTGKPITWYC